MLGLLVIFVTLLVIIGVVVVILLLKKSRRNIIKERLEMIRDIGKVEKKAMATSFDQEQFDKPFFERVIQPILERTSKKMKKDTTKADPIADMLIMAGNPGNLTSGQFKALQLLAAVISMTFCAFLGLLMPQPIYAVIFGAVAGGFSFIGPKFWLGKKITVRRKGIRKMIPDVLDLLCVSVEAGLGFDQALQKVVERMRGPLCEEFERMLQEVKIGKSRHDAMKSLTRRCQVEELDSLIAAILQADALGVSIGQILRIQSDQLRTKRRQMVEEMAQKLPIKMLFPMIFFIFPTIFIVTLGPIGIKVMRQMKGI